jgi:hypothetical protein
LLKFLVLSIIKRTIYKLNQFLCHVTEDLN